MIVSTPTAPDCTDASALHISQIRTAVRDVWNALVGSSTFERDDPWNIVGGDKLKLLRLAHGIERRIRRGIPLDLMDMRMRPSEFVARLAGHVLATTEPSSVAMRTIVVLPGARGDDPNLVLFRRLLSDKTTTCLLARYPPWEDLVTPAASLAIVVDRVIDQLEGRVRTGPLILLGYSVGGMVAHEVARRLAAHGEPVAFVGLIDAFVTRLVPFDLPFDQAPSVRSAESISKRIGYRLAWLLHRRPAFERFACRFKGRITLPRDLAFYLRHYMTLWVQWAIAETWTPNVFERPVTLFRAKSHSAQTPWDLGWTAFTPDLTIEHVDGNHFSIIGGTHSKGLADTIRAAISAVR